MKPDSASALRLAPAAPAPSHGPHANANANANAGAGANASATPSTAESWQFCWTTASSPEPLAHLTGLLRWQGHDIGFAADGLAGIDGRITAPALATLAPHLQPLVLHHFADECLHGLDRTPLSGMALVSVDWHEDPLPMQGEFDFSLHRSGARGLTLGRLTAFDEAGRLALFNALAQLGWPLPAALAQVAGRLQLGTLALAPDELQSLEVGDLVWVDSAEVTPAGLRAQFLPQAGSGAEACTAWLRRSEMKRDALQPVQQAASDPAPGLLALSVLGPPMAVERTWLQQRPGRAQRLPATALGLTWVAALGGHAVFEGRLMVIGRRIALRVTHRLPPPGSEFPTTASATSPTAAPTTKESDG